MATNQVLRNRVLFYKLWIFLRQCNIQWQKLEQNWWPHKGMVAEKTWLSPLNIGESQKYELGLDSYMFNAILSIVNCFHLWRTFFVGGKDVKNKTKNRSKSVVQYARHKGNDPHNSALHLSILCVRADSERPLLWVRSRTYHLVSNRLQPLICFSFIRGFLCLISKYISVWIYVGWDDCL